MSLLLNHPMVARESWESFTESDHNTWNTLFGRQAQLLQDRAASEVLEGMQKLAICHTQIPKFSDLNSILQKETGFSIVPVEGLIPDDLFFGFLAERKFPSTCFIRKPHQLDYLEEPDIFHDVFGHAPLLVNPVFADFMQEFGRKGLEAIECDMLEFAATLYWFTVEFGLITTAKGARIYGAGILSSKGETIYALDSHVPLRLKFNSLRVMSTQYHTDSFQRTYFAIENFQELFDALRTLNFDEVGNTCKLFPKIEQGIFVNHEEIL